MIRRASSARPIEPMSEYPGKRLLDIVMVSISAPFWLPAMVIVAAIVRLRLGSPVIFRQRRPGLNHESFELFKFRTMRDATASDGRPLPDAERLTPFGKALRASSLDELPELLNVLRGDMSLVGPRPLLPQYVARFSIAHRRRHAVRPGLTGLAQVSGRNALSWTERFDLDVRYVDECSFRLDMRILAATFRTVMRRDGISAPGEVSMPEFTGYDPPAP